jgi:hypothetical protein
LADPVDIVILSKFKVALAQSVNEGDKVGSTCFGSGSDNNFCCKASVDIHVS